MTVPSRTEAARLLLSLDPPAWHLRHSRAVAEIAAWLADRIAPSSGGSGRPRGSLAPGGRSGGIFDPRLVETAALLHDIDKVLPRGTPEREVEHGTAGARWLSQRGHPELATAVALHPVTCLLDDDGARDLHDAPAEAKIVAYADKRAGQRLEPMADRFAHWDRRHPDGWARDVRASVWNRALGLEREVCAMAGVDPSDVRRLPWTARAIRAARASTTLGRVS